MKPLDVLAVLAVLALWLGLAACASAPTPPERRDLRDRAAAERGPIVRSVRVQGPVSQDDFSRYLRYTRVGRPLSPDALADDMRSLWTDHRLVVVAVSKKAAPDGGVHVTFEVQGGDSGEPSPSPELTEIIEQKIALAREAVDMARAQLERARGMEEASQLSPAERQESERGLHHARLRLLECRQELGRDVDEILQRKIAVAQELVASEKAIRDTARLQRDSGRSSGRELIESEQALLEARLRVLDYQEDLQLRREAKAP